MAQIWFNVEADLIENHDTRVPTNIVWVSYVPYDTHIWYNHIITSMLQLYLSIFSAYGYGASDNFIVVLVCHVTGQLSLIQVWLRNLRKCNNPKDFWKILRHITEKHEKVIKYELFALQILDN